MNLSASPFESLETSTCAASIGAAAGEQPPTDLLQEHQAALLEEVVSQAARGAVPLWQALPWELEEWMEKARMELAWMGLGSQFPAGVQS